LACELMLDGKLVCVSLDIETCGCWIVQTSAQLHRLGGVGKKQEDTLLLSSLMLSLSIVRVGSCC